jgi:hypothetical protein
VSSGFNNRSNDVFSTVGEKSYGFDNERVAQNLDAQSLRYQ